ncbi:MAG: cyclic nucleotide-binding domain-containing protein [Anaeromyxobacteraceae bacterium]|nr:cyclic nucleotide-binding domain-containing protein [Anaeromyxobacteraceae bacterium]
MDAQALRRCPLFQTLSSAQLAKIAAIAAARELPGGASVFKEGDPGEEMYVVISGRVRISKMVRGVGEEALTILEAGAYFGEMAMIDDAPRSADAIAHTPCALAVIRRDDLDQLMFVDKELAYVLLWTFVRTLSTRLREMNDKIQGFFAMTGPFR